MKRHLAAMLRAIPDAFLHRLPGLVEDASRAALPLALILVALAMAHDVGMRTPYAWIPFGLAVLIAGGALGYAVDRAEMRAKTAMATSLFRFIGEDSSAEITVRHESATLTKEAMLDLSKVFCDAAVKRGWQPPADPEKGEAS